MIIVLIHWKIVKGREDEFLSDWNTKFTVQNRAGMVGEYMSAVKSRSDHPYITWPIDCEYPHNAPNCSHFINVSVWESAARFHDEVARHFNDASAPLGYEIERRRRAVIAPVASRRGPSGLPDEDVAGME